ncbi:SMI1/KNR4 family protein [Streptomyces sp. NPDC006283]|uniref:SMI1/KNR4 family protein n=1 Tax=Streptomyces sp. NPDC006283 TaxID=3156741 RepID=UPI0033BE04D0
MTANSAFMRLVTPPATPIDARGNWTAAENALGTPLPADYKHLVETYGWGEFCDYLNLHTPFGTHEHIRLEWQRGTPSGTPERDRERYPYPLHPAPGGLLVWGTTIDADRLCWLTEGAPVGWPVVVWSRDGWYETHPMGTAAFVEAWAGARLETRLLADMEPDLAPWFNAFRPRTHRCLRLSDGPYAHDRRLAILRDALAPTVDRGSWRTDDGDLGQDHFATADTDWLLTYDMSRPHQIRISFPPEDSAAARRCLFAAVRRMGCEVVRISASDGTPLSAWSASADEDA